MDGHVDIKPDLVLEAMARHGCDRSPTRMPFQPVALVARAVEPAGN